MSQRRQPPPGLADTAPTEIIDDVTNPEFGGRRLALEESVGTVLLGRFELVEFIGEGGMSGVYKAVDRRKVEGRADDPHVAVKLFALSFADHSAALAEPLTKPRLVEIPAQYILAIVDVSDEKSFGFLHGLGN